MIINSISLKNFRQYKGMQHIDFSTDSEKNVTVIIGQNTCGKTTLVQAFIWCLYGGKGNFPDKKLLNEEENQELLHGIINAKKDVSVSIDLIHDGVRKRIFRKRTYILNSKGKVVEDREDFKIYDYKDGSFVGNMKTDIELRDEIQSILPQNLSDYFFFWGERIENLSKKSNISRAVKDFLGLTTLDNVKTHLDMAIKNLTSRVGDADKTDTFVANIKNQIAEKEDAIEKNQLEFVQVTKDYNYYLRTHNELENELQSTENKSLAQKQNDLKKYRDSLLATQSRLHKKEDDYIRAFNSGAVNYFSSIFSYDISDLLNNYQDDKEGWVNVNVKTIQEILDKGVCICGNKFTEGDETYRLLQTMKKYVSPNYIAAAIDKFKYGVNLKNKNSYTYSENMKNRYKDIDDLKKEILEYESKIKMLDNELSSTQDISYKYAELKGYRAKYIEKSNRLATLKTKIDSDQKYIEGATERMQAYLLRKNKNDKVMRCLQYAKKLKSMINSEYEIKENEIKVQLQEYVKTYFKRMYSGDRDVELDDNYIVQAYNYVNGVRVKSDGSPGLETVKNFAFIAGLVQIAKDKVSKSNKKDDIISSEPYPLVLDAPFSQADEKHVPAISELLTETAEQIILVVMRKDWNYAEAHMKDKVGKYYELQKVTETHTNIIQSSGDDYDNI